MLRWLVREMFVILIAATMGYLGLVLMFLGGPYLPGPGEFWTRYVVGVSVLLWSLIGLGLGRREPATWATWAGWGLLSPILGCLVIAPPASFAFVMVKGYVAFPVGLATGLMMAGVFRFEFPRTTGLKGGGVDAISPPVEAGGPALRARMLHARM